MSELEMWKQRVAEWKASGLKASAYCAGRDFEVKRLYQWATRLNRIEAESPESRVRMARVVLRGRQEAPATREPAGQGTGVSIELQGVRVVVPPGVDRATLSAVLDALDARAARGAR